ncbi:PREDICTED: uncharacterized protein LOC108573939 [Habropoda laboriosa]|uniref:uncharacterized protein LOC108573939 n=1 Tax=Habropoda laboriosa TaxID=597456 RepID=UPI00083D22F3|nr:PREDICTED: uncharacterized protein LOC108573939 [Habropoda laboriosa]
MTTTDFDIKKFWEMEEGPHIQHLSSEQRECEDHFTRYTKRDKSGRYVVALPFNDKKDQIGESYSRAFNRFLSLERKLNRDAELKHNYTAVIEEYRALGHMTQVRPSHSPGFYLPHHAVEKPSSTTTKVRLVFDGSAKSNSGLSLNDALMTGPTIQSDIFSLLLRFRMHAYVLTGDIEKMQHDSHEESRNFMGCAERYTTVHGRTSYDNRYHKTNNIINDSEDIRSFGVAWTGHENS